MAIQSPFAGETQKPGFFTPEMKEKMDEESKKNVEQLAKEEKQLAVEAEVNKLTQPAQAFADTSIPTQPTRSPSQVEIPQAPIAPAPTASVSPTMGYDKAIEKAVTPFIDQEKKAQDELNLKMSDVEKIKTEQAAMKPQARDYFYGKSTANKIFSAIGLALASLTPDGAKGALSIINNTIDRDLKDQEMLYNAKGKELEESKSIYKAYMDKLQNVQAAKLSAKNDMLEKLKFQLQAQAQQTNAQEAKARLAIMQQQADTEMQKNNILLQKELASTKPGANLQNLPKEKLVYYTNANDALVAVNEMEKALAAGSNTYSVIGDNDFTFNRGLFADAIGRMQSGGAITEDEEKRFMNFAPGPFDTAFMQKKKIEKMKKMLGQRIDSIIGQEQLPTSARK